MDPFFPDFSFGARNLWRFWWRVLIPNFLLHRLPQQYNWSFCTNFLWLLAGLLLSTKMSEETWSSKLASGLRLVVLTRNAKIYMMVVLQFLQRHGIRSSCLMSIPPRRLMFFWGLFSSFVSLGLRVRCRRRRSSFSSLTTVQVSLYKFVMTETTWVSFRTLSMWLSLKTLSHFHLNVGFLSFLTLGDYSSFHNFASDSESEVSSSHNLIGMKFHRSLQS